MVPRMLRTILAAALALSLSGCFYPSDRGRQLETRVDQLEAKNTQLAQALADEQQKLAQIRPAIDQKIAEVTQALAQLNQAAHRTGADIGIQLQNTVQQVASLRGEVESYQHQIQDLQTGLKQLSDSTDQRITALQGEEAQREAEAKKRAEELKRPTGKKDFLALAETKAKAGDSALSRELYNEFLKKWPRDPLAGKAHFGLGESYYVDQKCSEALFEYGKVIQEFPKTKEAPTAYLHSADCFAKLKLTRDSQLALEQLVKSYPKSPEAKAAKKKLAALKKGKPAHKTK